MWQQHHHTDTRDRCILPLLFFFFPFSKISFLINCEWLSKNILIQMSFLLPLVLSMSSKLCCCCVHSTFGVSLPQARSTSSSTLVVFRGQLVDYCPLLLLRFGSPFGRGGGGGGGGRSRWRGSPALPTVGQFSALSYYLCTVRFMNQGEVTCVLFSMAFIGECLAQRGPPV